jgi:glycosyltransferase involved in cell wall biosynthesis
MNSGSNSPLVSIVFTSYNHAEYLQQAVDSLLIQTYDNFELIIVDDCSNDGSQIILKNYQSDPRVKLNLLEQNTGSYVKASNYAANLAEGDYLLFAQCDDFAHPAQLMTLVHASQQFQAAGVIWSKSNMVDLNGHVFEDDFEGREKKFRDRCQSNALLSGKEMRRFLAYSCVIPNLSAALIKKDLYLQVGKLSEKYLVASDWAFWLSLSEVTNFYYITEPLNNFRQHDTTIRNNIKIEKQILEIFHIFYEHISLYRLNANEALNLRVGAGFVWISYIFHGHISWFKCFFSIYKKTLPLDKFNLIYLIVGFGILFREVLYNRFK